jgi:hypothetical protein
MLRHTGKHWGHWNCKQRTNKKSANNNKKASNSFCKKKAVVPVLNKPPRHEGEFGEQRYSFTPRSLYPQGKSLRYPLDRRLGGTQSRSGRSVEEKNSQPPPGFEPRSSDRPARSQSPRRLTYPGSQKTAVLGISHIIRKVLQSET